ncbi:hypothetical protein [Sphingomonas sp.]|uniref:hypothetical protein n=1 Tax=Sphingomonas sp. TaxID=28214 RepID=UPI001B0DA070|nr:hypothetical protein [Sphingomonas sp.]MBO9713209.1 hypothetical protein [Sphingomonas sp.]
MLFAALLLAVQTAPQCAATDAALPAKLAGWTTPADSFGPGKAVVLDARDGAVMIGFKIEAAGKYGVALDQKGWIDVTPFGADKPLESVEHGHGPDCSSIAKIVAFQLEPGVYTIKLSKLAQPKARLMLVAP